MRSGHLLARLTVAPTLAVSAWLLAGLPLLFAGVFQPGLAFGAGGLAAALALALGLRHVPERVEAPWWATAGVCVVAAGFAVLQIAVHSEQVIVRRDPASYFQFAVWLGEHGSLPIPQHRALLGGADPALSYDSLAFYQRGETVVPQFMAGLPMTLTALYWLGGSGLTLLGGPLLGAASVLTFGGLAARLVGGRWAPLAALTLALTLPQQYVSRATFSEPLGQLLLLGGLCLAVDARDLAARPARVAAGLAGLALGLTVLVRIDGLRDVLPAVGYAGLLLALHRPGGLPLGGGLALGVGAGLAEGYLLSRPYLDYLAPSMRPLLPLAAAVVAATAAGVALFRWRRPRIGRRLRAWAVGAASWLVVLVMAGFALRPYLQTTDGERDPLTRSLIARLQALQHLPVQPGRQYAEYSLYWVMWYLGLPALLAATVGAALLVRRVLRGGASRWVLPYAVIAWTTVATLWRPAITPDHPWASRRLVPLVLPGLALLATWLAAHAIRWLRRLGHRPATLRGGAALVALAMLVPITLTSFGLMFTRTDAGELRAVTRMCASLGPGASAVVVERVTADRFTQLLRGMCGVPAARMRHPTPQAVARVVDRIRAAGAVPVLLGAAPADLAPYGGRPVHILALRSRQDEHSLVNPPGGTWRLEIDVWMSLPPG